MATKTAVNIRPLDDRIVLVPDEAESKTGAGIYLPESAQEKPMQGEVIAVGPGKLNDDDERTAMTVKVGDKVVYGKYAGTEIEFDGDNFVILHESDLLAKLQ
ncbi:MAG: co-chaperone GroES [Phycisphaerae bacterium]|nr:co-chaperone GroES [Phycisphaerae bacterium]